MTRGFGGMVCILISSVKSAYSVLRGHREGICQNCTTFFWSIKALPAAQVLAWSWVTSKIPSACFSFFDWCLALLSCLKSI